MSEPTPDPLLDEMAQIALALQQVDPALHQVFIRILQDRKDLRETARKLLRSRHDDLDTGSMNWVAVLDCHLQRLAELLEEPAEVEGSLPLVKLWEACEGFVAKYQPRAPESLYQVDSITEALPELAESVCGIVGYWKDDD